MLQMWLVKVKTPWSRVALVQHDVCPYKRRPTCTGKKAVWSPAAGATWQQVAGSQQKLGEAWADSASVPSEGCQPYWHLDFPLQNCERIHICCWATQSVVLCQGSPRKQIRSHSARWVSLPGHTGTSTRLTDVQTPWGTFTTALIKDSIEIFMAFWISEQTGR